MKKSLPKPRNFSSKIFFVLSLLTSFAFIVNAQYGMLDTDFGTAGIVTSNIGTGERLNAIDILPDGRIVVAGSAEISGDTNIIVAMYHPDGSKVNSFGTNGATHINLTTDDNAFAIKHVIKKDKNDTVLIIGGETDDKDKKYMSFICLNTDGSLNTSFNSNGTLITTYQGKVHDLAIYNPTNDPKDIEIYAAGDYQSYFAVLKIDIAGAFITSFGNNGISYENIGFDAASAQSLVFEEGNTDNFVSFAGYIDDSGINFPFMGRLKTSDGNPDGTFGKSGFTVLKDKFFVNAKAHALKIQNLNSQLYYVLGGTIANEYTTGETEDFLITRITAAGDLDITFGDSKTPGCNYTDLDKGSIDKAHSVLVQVDGNLIICGNMNTTRVAMAKYNADGTQLDNDFGNAGIVVEDDFPDFSAVYTLQPDNKILVAGANLSTTVTTRYTNAPLSPFLVDGYIITDTTDNQLGGAIHILPDDRIVVAGTSEGDKVTSVYTVAMYNPDGTPVSTFGANGIINYEISGTDSAFAIAHYILPKNDDTLLVVAGSSYDGKYTVPSAICIDTDGNLITSFGENGHLLLKDAGQINDLVINNPTGEPGDIEIFAAADLYEGGTQFAVLKMDYTGGLDTKFGSGGIVQEDLNLNTSSAQSIIYQQSKDNYVVFAGYGDAKGTDISFIGRIFASDGSPDNYFGKDGYAMLDAKTLANAQTHSLDLQNYNSQIYYVVGGTAANDYTVNKTEDFFVARTNMDGRLDENFGIKATPGCRFTNFFGTSPASLDYATTVLAQNNGSLLLTGHTNFNKAIKFALVKYQPDGSSVDSIFGNNGTIVSNMIDLNTISAEAAILSDNNVVQTGTIYNADKSTDIITAWFENLDLITKHPEDKQICEGEGVTMSIQVIGCTDCLFEWVKDKDGSGQNIEPVTNIKPDLNIVTLSKPAEAYYACKVYTSKGVFLSISDYAFVEVNKMPDVYLGPDEVVCDGGSKILDAGNTGMDYLWDGGETTRTKTATASGTYSVTVTNPENTSCKDHDTINVTISFGPTVNLRDDTAVCVEDNVSMQLDAGPEGASYDWNSGQTTQTIDVTEENTYTVTVTDSDGCTAIDHFILTVWNTSVNFADTLACTFDVDGGINFYLDVGPMIDSVLSSSSWYREDSELTDYRDNYVANITQSGEYAVEAEDVNGCTTTDTFMVTRFNPVDIDLGNDTSVCKGQNVILDATDLNDTPISSYNWSTGETSQTIDITSTGKYFATVTNSGGCADIDSALVNVFESEVNLGNDTSICTGNILVLDAGNAGATFEWSTGASSRTIEVNTDGMYHVTVSYPSVGCISAYDTINVSTYANTVNLELRNDTAICGGSLSLDAENAGASYIWSTGETSQTINADVTDNYAVTVTNPDNCVGTDNMTLTVNPVPVINLGNDTAICDGTLFQLDAENSGSTFNWSTGESSQTIDITTADNYSVTVTTPENCAATDSINIDIIDVPVVNLRDTAICPGNIVSFDAQNAGDEYLWSNGDTTQSIFAFSANTYAVTVTNGDNCSTADSAVLTVKRPYDDEQICIVTTDLPTNRNLIVIEKTPGHNTEKYFVYRETVISGSFSFIGEIPFNETSVFVDSTADPSSRQSIYKITSVDSCGNESPLDSSLTHKTLLLQYSGSTEGINLMWHRYEIDGEPLIFTTYHIYRGTDSTGLEFFDQVSGNTFAYIDNTAAAMSQPMYYRVYGIIGDQCYADAKLKASAGPFSQAISNMEDNRLKESDISKITGDVNLTIYPNPCDEATNITVSGNKTIQSISIFDCIGKLVSTINPVNANLYHLSVNDLPAGIYMVGVTLTDGTKGYNKLVVKTR